MICGLQTCFFAPTAGASWTVGSAQIGSGLQRFCSGETCGCGGLPLLTRFCSSRNLLVAKPACSKTTIQCEPPCCATFNFNNPHMLTSPRSQVQAVQYNFKRLVLPFNTNVQRPFLPLPYNEESAQSWASKPTRERQGAGLDVQSKSLL